MGDEPFRLGVSAAERDGRALSPESRARALAQLDTHGAVVLEGALAPALIDCAHEAFAQEYGALTEAHLLASCGFGGAVTEVGDRRFQILTPLRPPLAPPAIFAAPVFLPLLQSLLGETLQLNSLSVVVSLPGAKTQHLHRDHEALFPTEAISTRLPAYAVSVAVPLVDVDLDVGTTAVWPGSHRWLDPRAATPATMVQAPLVRGDCVLIDYRTLHAGMPNRSTRRRPILYFVYARTWFHDEVNHRSRDAVVIDREACAAFPPGVIKLLSRALGRTR